MKLGVLKKLRVCFHMGGFFLPLGVYAVMLPIALAFGGDFAEDYGDVASAILFSTFGAMAMLSVLVAAGFVFFNRKMLRTTPLPKREQRNLAMLSAGILIAAQTLTQAVYVAQTEHYMNIAIILLFAVLSFIVTFIYITFMEKSRERGLGWLCLLIALSMAAVVVGVMPWAVICEF
ncbi:MAG: hypothetical protein FWG90_09535 [Oscillospiraceae bacterium]|nr:hypothetical protein [Oscillospiraceae bacterium]